MTNTTHQNPLSPSVTIISVTFRDYEGIRSTRKSVLAQQYMGSIQHIIIDGGSGKKVISFLESQDKSGFEYLSERDSGIYDAMNKGISLATGDVIWFLNGGDEFADDYALHNALNNLESPKDDWGFGITLLLSQNGECSGVSFPVPYSYDSHCNGIAYVPHPSTFFGSEILKTIGKYNVKYPIVADQILILQAAQIKAPVIVPHVLSKFILGGISSTTPRRAQMKEFREAKKELKIHTRKSLKTRMKLTILYFKSLFN